MSLGANKQALMGAAGSGGAADDFYDHQISKSFRFESGYLKWTPGSAGNRQVWTFSMWVKKTENTYQNVLNAGTSGDQDTRLRMYWYDNKLYSSSANANFNTSTALYRDTSAWYHVVWKLTGGTSYQYVNGTLASSYSVSGNVAINNNVEHTLGIDGSYTAADKFTGYMAEVVFIDGTALDPTSFASEKNGVWIPDDVSGLTFGSQGYYLNFADSSSPGNDVSGNNNDWTNVSLATDDQMVDSPTFGSSSTGNCCTLNPLTEQSGLTISEGNLKMSRSSAGNVAIPATMGASTGKYYFEVYWNNDTTVGNAAWGFVEPESTLFGNDTAIQIPDTYNLRVNSGNAYINGAGVITMNSTTPTTGTIIGIAIDFDNGKIFYGQDGGSSSRAMNWNNSNTGTGVPASGTNPAQTFTAGSITLIPAFSISSIGDTNWILNFGQSSAFSGALTSQGNADGNGQGDFYYSPPSGFTCWATGGLSMNANVDPAQTDDNFPQALYDSKTWTGGGGSTAVSGLGFKPDFVWIKERENSSTFGAFNSTMGNTKLLGLGMTAAAEVDQSADPGLESFDSDGFTVDYPNTSDFYLNRSGEPYIAWNWRANGGTTSTNSTGSVSVTQQVDPSGAFSISTYTGAGGTGNIGHGLSSAATFVIIKQTNGVNNYCVYAKGAQDSGALFAYMDTNSIFQSGTIFGNTEPSSTLVYLGDNNEVNHTSRDYIAWCWANVEGYCKSGYYTGNADTDGTFVYLGFRPAFLMVRYIGSGESWVMLDDARDGYNVTDKNVRANSANAEASGSTYNIDFLSNGFKPRTTWEGLNGNGYRIVYIAMAHNPFKYAVAR